MHEAFVTVDVDWAPDWAMRQLMETLLEGGVRSTWFITHETEVLDDLRANSDLVELGIHPNFLPGSSHGNSASEVLAECLRIVPEATTMRAHCLFQSTPIFQTVVNETAITLDASIYLKDLTDVRASRLELDNGGSIARVPYVWEDDLEFFSRNPRWDALSFLGARHRPDEITIVDLHPIHYALNSADVRPYQAFKSSVGQTNMSTARQASGYVNSGPGAAGFVGSLMDAAKRRDVEFSTPLSSLARRC